MNQKNFAFIIVLILIIGAGSFFAGTKYQQSKAPAFGQFRNGQVAGARNANVVARGGFRPVNGDIISADANSITVKLADGSSKIILVNDKTAINKAQTATITDLTIGQKVAVFGSDNLDGSVTAQNIQLNPIGNTFGRPSGTSGQ